VKDRVGVVITLPEDTGTCLYHLCPQGGGDEWAARIDALHAHTDTAVPITGGVSYRTRHGDPAGWPEGEFEAYLNLTTDEAAMPPQGLGRSGGAR
jgi:hypothetical protein